jgi:sortase A
LRQPAASGALPLDQHRDRADDDCRLLSVPSGALPHDDGYDFYNAYNLTRDDYAFAGDSNRHDARCDRAYHSNLRSDDDSDGAVHATGSQKGSEGVGYRCGVAGAREACTRCRACRERDEEDSTRTARVYPVTRRLIVAAVLGGLLAAAPGASAAPVAGAPIGTIIIPRIHLRATFAQGVSAAVLARGPGHYPQTGLPGQQGTVGIAGHRITHTHPFRRLNVLRHGDRIVLVVGSSAHLRRLTYVVYAMRIVRPSVVWPLSSAPHAQRLVLTACHPPGSAAKRLVVFARRAPPVGQPRSHR